jgi:hypothetical protein
MADIAWRNHLELVATPRAASEARRHVRKILADWGYDHLIDAAELVISELATNALIATSRLAPHHKADWAPGSPGRIWIDLFRGPTFVVLDVWDASSDRPQPQVAAPDEEGGRGLALIETLAKYWGYRWLPGGGKIVWALLGAASDADAK